MRRLILPLAVVGLLCCFTMTTATADAQGVESSGGGPRSTFGSDPEDPSNLLTSGIPERRAQRESLLPVSPLKLLHDATDQAKDGIYRATHLKLGLTLNHLFQGLSEALPGEDDAGTATDVDFV